MKSNVRDLVVAGLMLALALVLPFVTMHVPSIGSALLPMHLPVLICGFICGWRYGLAVGLIAPLMRSLMFGMPPMYPTALAMCFELAAYGLLAGLLFNLLPKKKLYTYATLVLAMLGGRAVWGVVSAILYGVSGSGFTFQMFLAGAFVNALPGILLQLLIIPPIVIAIRRQELTAHAA